MPIRDNQFIYGDRSNTFDLCFDNTIGSDIAVVYKSEYCTNVGYGTFEACDGTVFAADICNTLDASNQTWHIHDVPIANHTYQCEGDPSIPKGKSAWIVNIRGWGVEYWVLFRRCEFK